MSDQNGHPRTAKERHAKFLEKHKARMRKVEETLDAVKARGRKASGREKRAGV